MTAPVPPGPAQPVPSTAAAPPPAGPGLTERAMGAMGIPGVKLALIGMLLLVMLIPTSMVSSQIEDRQSRQAEVERQLQSSWGPAQSVLGPVLMVPYRIPPSAADKQEGRAYLYVSPTELDIAAQLQPETRQRGFFRAIVYGAKVRMAGSFDLSGVSVPDVPGATLLWREASLLMIASDLRAIGRDSKLTWNGTVLPLNGPGRPADACSGLNYAPVPLGLAGAPATDRPLPFETAFDLRGVRGLRAIPQSGRLTLSIAAPWPTPGFSGASTPARSTVSPSGFSAEWDQAGAQNGTPTWVSGQVADCRSVGTAIYSTDEQVGVDLLEAMPTYRMVDRASKYTLLFLVLCFLTLFLFETLTGVAIGIVQYGMIGLSVSLFALLLVSFGEPLGFAPAYAVSAALVGVQGTLYVLSVTRRLRLAAVFGSVQAGLFGFLYVVLSLETYALLAGSVTLFAILSVLMVITRRIDFGARPAA